MHAGCAILVGNCTMASRRLAQATGARAAASLPQAAMSGGQNATRERYPYACSLQENSRYASPHFADGALVHERVVITAAQVGA